jgi:hypothetical protein
MFNVQSIHFSPEYIETIWKATGGSICDDSALQGRVQQGIQKAEIKKMGI